MRIWPVAVCLTMFACSRGNSETKPVAATPVKSELNAAKPEQRAAPEGALQAVKSAPVAAAEVTPAALGESAPSFSLPDLDGRTVNLADFKGKVVVLEWFNPECPFVKLSHTKGSLVNTGDKFTQQGVVWLAINSGAPGKQGHGAEASAAGRKRFNFSYPVLLDESGNVGRAYGAKHTPHLYIIDPAGKLVYRGGIDNSPDAEGESPEGGKLVNYVEQALREITAGRPVSMADTKAYGCSVKYGS